MLHNQNLIKMSFQKYTKKKYRHVLNTSQSGAYLWQFDHCILNKVSKNISCFSQKKLCSLVLFY